MDHTRTAMLCSPLGIPFSSGSESEQARSTSRSCLTAAASSSRCSERLAGHLVESQQRASRAAFWAFFPALVRVSFLFLLRLLRAAPTI